MYICATLNLNSDVCPYSVHSIYVCTYSQYWISNSDGCTIHIYVQYTDTAWSVSVSEFEIPEFKFRGMHNTEFEIRCMRNIYVWVQYIYIYICTYTIYVHMYNTESEYTRMHSIYICTYQQ